MSNSNNQIEKQQPPEESMSPLSSQLDSDSEVNNALSQLINISDNVLHEPTCIICSNPCRDEIEQACSSSQNIKESVKLAQKILKEKSNLTVSKGVIKNHLIHHCNKEIKEIQKIEYKDRLTRLSNVKLTTLDRIDLCFSALTERLMSVNSITPSKNYNRTDIEKIKSSETTKIMSSFDRLLKLQATILGEMKSNGELITIPRNTFVQFFTQMISNTQNDKERELIKKILNGLTEISKMT